MSRHKILKSLFILMIFAICCSLPALSQDDVETVQDSAFTQHRRAPAVFFHDEHNEKAGLEDDCSVCHHVWEDGVKLEDETSEDQECSECHLEEGTPNTMPLVGTYHKQCKGCHLAGKKGPVMCGECHPKRN